MLRNVLAGSIAATVTSLATACGPSTPAAESAHERGEEQGHHEEGDEHGKMSGPVHEFHEVLAPLWHADKGPERSAKTCAQALAMNDKAAAIVSAAPPEHADPAAWKDRASALSMATKALVAECEKEGRPEFEARFSDVHDRFHSLAEPHPH
jgi:hypothetical protein